ncbi:EF-hand calcium-binding domain-containing protein 11 [Pelodytes ibericus]
MFTTARLALRSKCDVTECDRAKYIDVFHKCDKGLKGYLSREDLKVAVVMLFGYNPSKVEVDCMISVLPNTEEVRLDGFLRIMGTKNAAQLCLGDQRQIFQVFDVHCRGYLTVEDFKRAFNRVAPNLCEQTVLEAFREVDRDSDGMICYKDFEFAMNYGQEEK